MTYLSTIIDAGDTPIQASTPISVPTSQSDAQFSPAARKSTRPHRPPTWLSAFVTLQAHHVPHKHLYPITQFGSLDNLVASHKVFFFFF